MGSFNHKLIMNKESIQKNISENTRDMMSRFEIVGM